MEDLEVGLCDCCIVSKGGQGARQGDQSAWEAGFGFPSNVAESD